MTPKPQYEIRAAFDETTLRVYQAYSHEIAEAALAAGKFVSPPFKMNRMTWIKPSFLWMMYRAGWGFKDDGQKRILAIDICRDGFEWALTNSCLSHNDGSVSDQEWALRLGHSPVRVQWDPERNLKLEPLAHRAIQIGLGGEAVRRYVNEWTVRINDVTPLAHRIYEKVIRGQINEAMDLVPTERPYHLDRAKLAW